MTEARKYKMWILPFGILDPFDEMDKPYLGKVSESWEVGGRFKEICWYFIAGEKSEA